MSVDDIAGQIGIALSPSFAGVPVHNKTETLNVANTAQLVEKKTIKYIAVSGHVRDFGSRTHNRDALHLRRLLRTRGDRPHHRCRAAEYRDELAPSHVSPENAPCPFSK